MFTVPLRYLLSFQIIASYLGAVQAVYDENDCGLVNPSPVGDVRTEVPWMASIFRKSFDNCDKWVLLKSGYIIGPSTVIMSGRHFWNFSNALNSQVYPIKPSDFLVGISVLSDDLQDADFYTHYYQVKSIIPHYQSFKKYSAYDIAIVHLKGSIQFNSYAKPICLSKRLDTPTIMGFSSISTSGAIKAGFRNSGGSQQLYKTPVILGNYPFQEDCSVQMQLKRETDIPIKRCIDLDDGLAFHHRGRWYLAALMTGGQLPDPTEEAWSFFSPVSKTYHWLQQSLACGSENFTCYEGKCIQSPTDSFKSAELLAACGEAENKYDSFIKSRAQCSNEALPLWCNTCTEDDSGMLVHGDGKEPFTTSNKDSVPIPATPSSTNSIETRPLVWNGNNNLGFYIKNIFNVGPNFLSNYTR